LGQAHSITGSGLERSDINKGEPDHATSPLLQELEILNSENAL